MKLVPSFHFDGWPFSNHNLCNPLQSDTSLASLHRTFWCWELFKVFPNIVGAQHHNNYQDLQRDQPLWHFHLLEDFDLFLEYFWPPPNLGSKSLQNCFSDLLVNIVLINCINFCKRLINQDSPLGFLLFLCFPLWKANRKTINQGLEQIELFISDENLSFTFNLLFLFQCSAQMAKFNLNKFMFDKMSNSQMQRYLSFPTSTHHPLKSHFRHFFLLISLLLMIKNYLLNCLSYL